MYSLGYIYKKAIYWYGCAAENGHIKGKYWFAKLSLENNSTDKETAYQFLLESATSDFGKAFNLLQKNAEDGVSIAQFFLGRYYTLKTDILRSLFGDAIWNKLLPETRHSLVSSAILIKECEGMPPEFDYSGNVSYDDAMDCCYEIYGVAGAHIDAKKQSAEIISLLRELFSILK